MMDIQQFRLYIIRPALEALGMGGDASEELLLGTAIQESRIKYLHQLGGGPAKGLFQMEPVTHDDIWNNWLEFRTDIANDIKSWTSTVAPNGHPHSDELIWNLMYAAMMCRIHYRRVSAPLPAAGDLPAQAAYWKKWYNTELGAGTEAEYIEHWNQVMT